MKTAAELDAEIRDIFAQDMMDLGNGIAGTLHVHYSDESVRQASLLPRLEGYGVEIRWHKS